MARARSMARERYRAPVNHLKKRNNNIDNKNKRAPENHLKKETFFLFNNNNDNKNKRAPLNVLREEEKIFSLQ